MSGNHGQSLKKAFKIIDAAKKSGANAIKLQTYTPDTITLNVKKKEFKRKTGKEIWILSTLEKKLVSKIKAKVIKYVS